jgi:hypothetical protein
MSIGSVAIFEGHIPYRRFLESIESRIHLLPRYRQRVVEPPFNVGRPTWEFDPEFDIRRHIIRVPCRHRYREQLRELTARLIRGQLDRSKPLWEVYLSKPGRRTRAGVEDPSRLVDGVSGVELMTVMLDLAVDPPAVIPPPAEPVRNCHLSAGSSSTPCSTQFRSRSIARRTFS